MKKSFLGFFGLLGFLSCSAPAALIISAPADAQPEVKQAFERIVAAADTQPLLKIMAGGQPVETKKNTAELAAGKLNELGLKHLVIIAPADDPLVKLAWQREAKISAGEIYAFGFGRFAGDLGWVESGFNPFLHSQHTAVAPYETELVLITGATPAGLAAAADRFLDSLLINGLVAAGAQPPKRLETTWLDREPLRKKLALPPFVPAAVQGWTLIGVTDCNAEVARGILDATGSEPDSVLTLKYHTTGAWDGGGADQAIAMYLAGLHRAAYGHTVLLARFKTPADAQQAAEKLNTDKRIQTTREQPEKPDPSRLPVTCWSKENYLLMSTLPERVKF